MLTRELMDKRSLVMVQLIRRGGRFYSAGWRVCRSGGKALQRGVH